jgi:hypothetical protein
MSHTSAVLGWAGRVRAERARENALVFALHTPDTHRHKTQGRISMSSALC